MSARRWQPACLSAKPNVPESVGASCRLDGLNVMVVAVRCGGIKKDSVVDVSKGLLLVVVEMHLALVCPSTD